MYVYIYMERQRERERENLSIRFVYVFTSVYLNVCAHVYVHIKKVYTLHMPATF